jgi:F-type H+-transporting ATPase subunit b
MLLAALAAQASESPIEVDANSTTFVHLAIFVALTFALKGLLFDPLLKLFEERERWTIGKRALAREEDEKSARAEAEYEKEMAKTRAAANIEREKLRAEGIRREQEILARARSASAEALENGKRAVQEEAARARASLKAEVGRMTADVGARVLGRGVQS